MGTVVGVVVVVGTAVGSGSLEAWLVGMEVDSDDVGVTLGQRCWK